MNDLKLLSSSDIFFYYGQNDVELETQHDLILGLVEPTRNLFYNRLDSARITKYENYPNALTLMINLKLDIVKWVAYRNTYVADGRYGFSDRRIAVSQNSIGLSQKNDEIDIDVQYISFNRNQQPQTINIPFSGAN